MTYYYYIEVKDVKSCKLCASSDEGKAGKMAHLLVPLTEPNLVVSMI